MNIFILTIFGLALVILTLGSQEPVTCNLNMTRMKNSLDFLQIRNNDDECLRALRSILTHQCGVEMTTNVSKRLSAYITNCKDQVEYGFVVAPCHDSLPTEACVQGIKPAREIFSLVQSDLKFFCELILTTACNYMQEWDRVSPIKVVLDIGNKMEEAVIIAEKRARTRTDFFLDVASGIFRIPYELLEKLDTAVGNYGASAIMFYLMVLLVGSKYALGRPIKIRNKFIIAWTFGFGFDLLVSRQTASLPFIGEIFGRDLKTRQWWVTWTSRTVWLLYILWLLYRRRRRVIGERPITARHLQRLTDAMHALNGEIRGLQDHVAPIAPVAGDPDQVLIHQNPAPVGGQGNVEHQNIPADNDDAENDEGQIDTSIIISMFRETAVSACASIKDAFTSLVPKIQQAYGGARTGFTAAWNWISRNFKEKIFRKSAGSGLYRDFGASRSENMLDPDQNSKKAAELGQKIEEELKKIEENFSDVPKKIQRENVVLDVNGTKTGESNPQARLVNPPAGKMNELEIDTIINHTHNA
jgi:hypothetical protein